MPTAPEIFQSNQLIQYHRIHLARLQSVHRWFAIFLYFFSTRSLYNFTQHRSLRHCLVLR